MVLEYPQNSDLKFYFFLFGLNNCSDLLEYIKCIRNQQNLTVNFGYFVWFEHLVRILDHYEFMNLWNLFWFNGERKCSGRWMFPVHSDRCPPCNLPHQKEQVYLPNKIPLPADRRWYRWGPRYFLTYFLFLVNH